jgi:nucleoside-diphosphate-sugar epimerase
MGMAKDARIYVAGHRGLAGSALWRTLQQAGFTHLIGRTHGELELTDAGAVREFFATERPEYVFLAAARVGGIQANSSQPADFSRYRTTSSLPPTLQASASCSSSAVRASTRGWLRSL